MTKLEERFFIHVSNFFNDRPEHRDIILRSYLGIPDAPIDDWLKGENFPEQLVRTRIEDFIWNHYTEPFGSCVCKNKKP